MYLGEPTSHPNDCQTVSTEMRGAIEFEVQHMLASAFGRAKALLVCTSICSFPECSVETLPLLCVGSLQSPARPGVTQCCVQVYGLTMLCSFAFDHLEARCVMLPAKEKCHTSNSITKFGSSLQLELPWDLCCSADNVLSELQ